MSNNELLEKWLDYNRDLRIWELCGGKEKGEPAPIKNFEFFPEKELLDAFGKFLGM